MVARLILLMLLACLALPPAAAPCHEGGAGMAMTHGTPAPTDKAIAVHSCLGCIPPATLLRHAVAVPTVPKALRAPIVPVRFDRARAAPPATPPPRGGA